MIGAVICTHGDLGQALFDTARMIVGDFEDVRVVSVRPGDSMEDIRARLGAAIDEVDHGMGVMVLCDMFGGTPSNLGLSFLSDQVEVLTGVNLPMLLKLYTTREGPLPEVAAEVRDHARDHMRVGGEMLKGKT